MKKSMKCLAVAISIAALVGCGGKNDVEKRSDPLEVAKAAMSAMMDADADRLLGVYEPGLDDDAVQRIKNRLAAVKASGKTAGFVVKSAEVKSYEGSDLARVSVALSKGDKDHKETILLVKRDDKWFVSKDAMR